MSVVWFATSFDYYLLSFLANTFENPYPPAVLGSIAELIAYAVAGVLYKNAGLKISVSSSFGLALFGGICMLIWGLNDE